jgi:hypothetical protein
MKTLTAVLACLIVASLALAAGIDGKWYSERKMERDGQSFTIKQTIDLKSEGSALKGKITMEFGNMEPRSIDISEGKVNGDKFSFVTVMQMQGNEIKVKYEGTVEGDTIKGTATRDGGGQSRPFEAKRK